MKIVIVMPTFSKGMGYIGNLLPKYLAKQGLDVHVIATNLPHNYQLQDYEKTYGRFREAKVLDVGVVESYEGYTLHILPHKSCFGHIRIIGLRDRLKKIKPDIAQCFTMIGWIPLELAFLKLFFDYKLFTGSHTAASMFSLAKRKASLLDWERLICVLTRTLPGTLVNLAMEKCYCPTEDCAEIAWRFFGAQRHKVQVMYLGVDVEFFYPAMSENDLQERTVLRQQLGYSDQHIICIYTGKLSLIKNAFILAQAIEHLNTLDLPFRGLFIGEGVQREEIETTPFCQVLDFMPFQKLGAYYRASDIGVWPTNESTSMLDAAACGIPLVVSDGIVYRAHVEGNGCVFKMDDSDDLVAVLLRLSDSEKRKSLGSHGADKMAQRFSWVVHARSRLRDYQIACGL